MTVYLGSDHRGFTLKEQLVSLLTKLEIDHKDMGTFNEAPVDYPDTAQKVCLQVASSVENRGILVCGTGVGMSIAANKIPNIRAALCSDPITTRMARQHTDINVLCMGGDLIDWELAKELCRIFLETEFQAGRHSRRLKKVTALMNTRTTQK